MAFNQFKLDRSVLQARGIFNKYVYETNDTISEVQVSGYFGQSRFIEIDGPMTNSDGWVGGIIECNCSDGFFRGQIQSNGESIVSIESGGSSVIDDLTPYQVPMKDLTNTKLVYSGATVDNVSSEWTFDKSINVPAGSINVGAAATLSEGGEDLLVLGNITDKRGFALTADFDETGSMIPDYVNLGTEFFNVLNPNDSDIAIDNPLLFSIVGGVTPPNIRQTNQVTFRASQAMPNVTSRVTDTASGTVIRYIPDRAAWDSNEGGLDFIAGDNIIDFISREPSTTGVFNIGTVPFRLESGQQIDIEIKADAMHLQGIQAGSDFFPYLTQLIQEGPLTSIATQEYVDNSHPTFVFKQLGTSSTNATYFFNPQTLISEVINYPFEDVKITISFESSNTATNRSTILGLFIDGILVDNESNIEPKDTRNNYYQSKTIDYSLSTGNHNLEVRFGRGNGFGGALAEISNLRIFIEELR